MHSKNTSVKDMEFLGHALCLDFINTIEYRVAPKFEPVNDFFQDLSSILEWGKRSGILTNVKETMLKDPAFKTPKLSESIRLDIISFRELLHGIFAAIACGNKPQSSDLERFSAVLAKYAKARLLVYSKGRVKWEWLEELGVEAIQIKIAYSAEQLLLSADPTRIRQCPAADCGWLFLDTSKNGKRHWCDMDDCGNRAKAKRHYVRSKKVST